MEHLITFLIGALVGAIGMLAWRERTPKTKSEPFPTIQGGGGPGEEGS